MRLRDNPWVFTLAPIPVFAGFMAVCFGACIGFPCFPTGFRYGIWSDRCPAGELRVGVEANAYGLVRGGAGTLSVRPFARYVLGDGPYDGEQQDTLWRGVDLDVALLDSEEKPVSGLLLGKWRSDGWRDLPVTLPDVPDGDYTLRITARAAGDESAVDLPLALYAPALAHVASDRPLYKPGQEVMLRSALLRRTDLAPLEGRPGRWRITAPDGTEMLAEKDRTGPFGVADTSFPLDARAEIGAWTARFESGGASDQVSFDVRPFQLPRFTVELTPSARWYGIGDVVLVEGVARYTSGAPVANAPVSVTVGRGEGRWPPPLAWEEALDARTDLFGRFQVTLGDVPPDLIERATLRMSARVTEAAGETAAGATTLVLSKDDLRVEAVTELGDGLVGGFNNRAYVRVMTPDGTPVPLAEVTVTNPWDPTSKARVAAADADGVVALQLDPGEPVTVVDPAPPVRVRPLTPERPSLQDAREMAGLRGLDLAERRAVDAVTDRVGTCGVYAPGARSVALALRVDGQGAVRGVVTGGDALDRCVADATRAVRFPGTGEERTYAIRWHVPDTLVASFAVDASAAWGTTTGVDAALARAGLEARRCVPFGRGHAGDPLVLHWSVEKGSRALPSTAVVEDSSGLSPGELDCVKRAFGAARLDADATSDAMGVAEVSMSVPRPPGSYDPGPTTRTAYELRVAARTDGSDVGDTRLVLPVGEIPALRMRATPSLARPGDTVEIELLRGPSFSGELPEKLQLNAGSRKLDQAPVDAATRTAKLEIPADAAGFVHTEWGGARAVVWVERTDKFVITLSADKRSYRPGETAKLTLKTTEGDRPAEAGVTLAGVDQTLGQLAPLLGPDDWGRVTVRATSDAPAFGSFDPRSLALGGVRGENAAKAAVLRVTTLPMDFAGDEAISSGGSSPVDDVEVLTHSFYRALERTYARVRAWEKAAPEGELMTPAKMADQWDAALDELAEAGTPAVDAFGRRLRLSMLPPDLLAQVDPRQVVSDGVRLPEDVVSWERFVAEEVR